MTLTKHKLQSDVCPALKKASLSGATNMGYRMRQRKQFNDSYNYLLREFLATAVLSSRYNMVRMYINICIYIYFLVSVITGICSSLVIMGWIAEIGYE